MQYMRRTRIVGLGAFLLLVALIVQITWFRPDQPGHTSRQATHLLYKIHHHTVLGIEWSESWETLEPSTNMLRICTLERPRIPWITLAEKMVVVTNGQ
jgi:hypothetical protein